MPGKIGRYEIKGVAGQGAMGIVYVGHDPFVDRPVAVKIHTGEVKGNTAGLDEEAKRVFFNEARIAGALDHPHILKIYDAGEVNGQGYIVMEYVEEAEELSGFCSPKRLFPVMGAARLMRQCADALDYAHQRGVIHRDIKPANILLTKDDEIKIVDFGIAQRTRNEPSEAPDSYGSPLYMSPEQIRGEMLTGQADLFSLGVMMYELLAGQHPFAARDPNMLLENVLTLTPAPLEELRPGIPKALADIVRCAIEKQAERRYKTGADIVKDLDKVLARLSRAQMELTDAEKFQAVRKLKFFQEFSDAEVREVLKIGVWGSYPAGQAIIQEGEESPSFSVLVTGEAQVRRSGKEVVILSEGESIGEMGYLLGGRRSASVVAVREVTLLQINPPLREWASLPLQMRLNRVFQRILVERLASTTRSFARQLAV
jgi:serine/threonine protein kinase